MKKAVLSILFGLALTAALPVAASAQELVVGGQIVGIQVSTEGVLVAGIGSVETREGLRFPAADAGLRQGDLIMEVNGEKLDSAGALIEAVRQRDGAPTELLIKRFC